MMMKIMKMNTNSFWRGFSAAGFAARGVETMQTLIISLLVASCVIGHPGIQITVTQKGLDHLGGVIISELTHRLAGRTVSFGHNFPTSFEEIRVSANFHKITGVSIPAYNVTSKPGSGIILAVTDLQVNISGLLRYNLTDRIMQEEPEDVTVSAEGVSIEIKIQIRNIDGVPYVHATCSSTIQKTFLLFQPGSPSGVSRPTQRFLEKLLGNRLKKDVSRVLCDFSRISVKELIETHLDDFPWKARVGSTRLDWSLVGEATYGDGFLLTSHKGQFSGDEEELQEVKMNTNWMDGMIKTSLSKEVFKSFLRVQSKYNIGSHSFEAVLSTKMLESLGMNLETSGDLFVATMKKKGEQDVAVNSDGIVTKLMGSLSFVSKRDSSQSAHLDFEITGTYSVEPHEGNLLVKPKILRASVRNENISEEALGFINDKLNNALADVSSYPPDLKLPLIKGLVNSKTAIFYNEHFVELVTEL